MLGVLFSLRDTMVFLCFKKNSCRMFQCLRTLLYLHDLINPLQRYDSCFILEHVEPQGCKEVA